MINLPIEEHIKEIESLTEEQYQEFLSKLPLCNSQETPMHAIEVDYTMENDGVDAEDVITIVR